MAANGLTGPHYEIASVVAERLDGGNGNQA
jgi:hypothetical protein